MINPTLAAILNSDASGIIGLRNIENRFINGPIVKHHISVPKFTKSLLTNKKKTNTIPSNARDAVPN